MNTPQPYLTVASILSGFGISVFMFRHGEKPEDRHKGEPIERVIVITAGVLATLTFAIIVLAWSIWL